MYYNSLCRFPLEVDECTCGIEPSLCFTPSLVHAHTCDRNNPTTSTTRRRRSATARARLCCAVRCVRGVPDSRRCSPHPVCVVLRARQVSAKKAPLAVVLPSVVRNEDGDDDDDGAAVPKWQRTDRTSPI